MIDYINAVFLAIWGHRWTHSQGEDFSKDSFNGTYWLNELSEFTKEELDDAIQIAKIDEYPPTLGQFKLYCMGVIQLHMFLAQCDLSHEYKSKFTHFALEKVDKFRLKTCSEKEKDKILKDGYFSAVTLLSNGTSLKDYEVKLPIQNNVKKIEDHRINREAMASIKAML